MTGFTVRIFRLLNFSYVQNNKNRKELVVPGTIKFPEHSNPFSFYGRTPFPLETGVPEDSFFAR